ncbi:thermosome subunit [Sulfolobus sp. A20]|uniref:thermosome subunit alpha n=1 Tax=Sulfolobaceae TaxID=118883 RepID=UPI00084611FD|nr:MULTISPECIES: thermosome subunit alpha [unclassified Sulfolobus]TRM75833.1 thermosome subunit [Sulfolobus sp. A20-N-F8]TRM81451.1 thermosome subunit [Sulfolobus sp. D5]TRM82840.1 thermosome subunit [Sulfolobus sp. A20-N-F6]TRM89046.1 thermosome subunit [Sulfolobus sp. C3]TRM95282.1 thermosome subunit [Sulfolobus sp. A20-N-G8]TRM98803.1 thermosome subunit [Sulfolobus sp. E1]TRN02164.1 thermosome subunit [Sulfolobus sp. F1]
MAYLFKEGTQRSSGNDVILNNIAVAKILSEMLKSSLGPKGLDKMLIEGQDITITNDGATIVKNMEVEHPTAKILIETAKTLDSEVGDGTTSVVVLAGLLLEKAEDLINQKIHPTTIIEGYRLALNESLKVLKEISDKITPENRKALHDLIYTTLSSKFFSTESTLEKIIGLVIEASLAVLDKRDGQYNLDIKNIKTVKINSGEFDDSELFNGVVLDKEPANENMPKFLENVKILLIDFPLKLEKTEINMKLGITDPTQMKAYLDEQTAYIKQLVDKIKSLGAKVVISQKDIDEVASYLMAKNGIIAVKNVKRSDIELLSRATGARIVSSIKDVSESDLGEVKVIELRNLGKNKFLFIKSDKAKAVTVIIRGSSSLLTDEAERSLNDAFNSVRNLLLEPYILPGGGAVEEELALKLKESANKIKGKEQIAFNAFADALEEYVVTLANTAGMDPTNTLVEIRSKHAKGLKNAGIDVIKGQINDNMYDLKVIDSLRVKEQVIKSATEAATAVLKIDDVIAAAPAKQQPQQQPYMG